MVSVQISGCQSLFCHAGVHWHKLFTNVFMFLLNSDCGEQRVHTEEPLLPAGGGDAVLSSPRQPGAGHPLGILFHDQGFRLHLLGQEEAR